MAILNVLVRCSDGVSEAIAASYDIEVLTEAMREKAKAEAESQLPPHPDESETAFHESEIEYINSREYSCEFGTGSAKVTFSITPSVPVV